MRTVWCWDHGGRWSDIGDIAMGRTWPCWIRHFVTSAGCATVSSLDIKQISFLWRDRRVCNICEIGEREVGVLVGFPAD